jgi:hypothetical protein
MAFDPTTPVENTPLDAAEMRDQLNGLKSLQDAKASGVPNVQPLNIPFHDPPIASDFDPLIAKINELIAALQA